MGKTKWYIWAGLAAVVAVIVWKRCELPVISKYLCGGGEAETPELMPGAPGGNTGAIMNPASADPGMMSQMQGRMQQLGPGGGRDPVSGAFLPTPTPNANLARIKVS